jgi:hypothetical protein
MLLTLFLYGIVAMIADLYAQKAVDSDRMVVQNIPEDETQWAWTDKTDVGKTYPGFIQRQLSLRFIATRPTEW